MAMWIPRRWRWWVAGTLLAAGLAAGAVVLWPRPSFRIVMHDVTDATGITFRHTDGGCGQRYVMETVCCGLALFDYDGDGLTDIYFLNGAPLQGCRAETKPRNALYRNLGSWRFAEVTAEAGVGDTGYSLGVAVADYDNDGDPDVFVNNFGPDVLYRNNGDGTFTDVAAVAGVLGGPLVAAGACFLDIDRDGNLDLYAGEYLEFSYAAHNTTSYRGVPAYVSPKHYPPVASRLHRNNGNGAFADVSQASGIAQHASWAMGMVCADYDDDGDTDVFVGNDVAENFLFQNDGSGHFEEVGLLAGVACDGFGSPQGSMGVECGDYDNDGRLDFYQTSYQLQHAVLFRNLGGGQFEDVSFATGAGAGTYAHVTWGSGLIDFDNDGDRDLYVARGHLQDRVEEYDTSTSYRPENILLENLGDGHFTDVSHPAGDGMRVRESSRGAAFDDLDGDGLVDVVVLNSRAAPTVLRNGSGAKNRWIEIRLCGLCSNRDGVGARVKVTTGGRTQTDEVHSGRSYQSHYGTRLHFGLGRCDAAERIEVRWPSGTVDVVHDLASGQHLVIIEGQHAAR